MLLKIVQVGDPVLRLPAQTLTREQIRSPAMTSLVELMRETMRDAPGVGLAAPQIGEPIALTVIEDPPSAVAALSADDANARQRRPVPFHVLFNPRLTVVDATPAQFFEGCLSVTGFVAEVPRALAVRVEALDHNGDPVVINADGWYARILQHEIDHLAGTLYIDRMLTRTFANLDAVARRR